MQFTTTLLLSGLASLTLAAPTDYPLTIRQSSSLDCGANRDNHRKFLSDSGVLYELLCSTDYLNGDLSSSPQSSLTACINQCDTTSGCLASVYANGICYLKRQLYTPNPNTYVTTAKRVFINSMCQPDQADRFLLTTLSSPTVYRINCATDFFGGDIIPAANGSSLADCIKSCGATPTCLATTYHLDQCYNKFTLASARSDIYSASAVKAIDCFTGASNGLVYPFPSGKKFTVQCGTSQFGGDLTIVPTFTLEDCMDACDKNAQCGSVTWTPGLCRLKQVNPNAVQVPGAVFWSATLTS